METFNSKFKKLPGTNYTEIKRRANSYFLVIKGHTKRRPYIRSAYFKGEKIFFDYFWLHLANKNFSDKLRRLKFFPAATDLVKNNKIKPIIIKVSNRAEIYYRFSGITKDKYSFLVQIKENRKNGQKFFISCFPGN